MTKNEKIRQLLDMLNHRENARTAVEATLGASPLNTMLNVELYTEAFMLAAYERMLNETVKVYAKTFSDKELDALLVLYDSPVGKVLNKFSDMTVELIPILTKVADENQFVICNIYEKLCEEN